MSTSPDSHPSVAELLHEAAETHHTVYRITDGEDPDWASWYADWLLGLSELPDVLGARPVRSHLVHALVELDRSYTETNPSESWEPGTPIVSTRRSRERADSAEVQLRLARHTSRLEAVVRFYRDGLGLTEVGRFEGHEGYDGVFLAVPGTDTHLEFTSGGGQEPPAPHPETLLVLYLGSAAAVAGVRGRVGVESVEPANPYWRSHGVTLADPDGFRVVLVPEPWPTP